MHRSVTFLSDVHNHLKYCLGTSDMCLPLYLPKSKTYAMFYRNTYCFLYPSRAVSGAVCPWCWGIKAMRIPVKHEGL